MKLTLSSAELLAHRRVLGGLEGRRHPTVDRADGIDIDTVLSFRLRQWYLDLLDHGDPRLLAPENIAATCNILPETAPAGGILIELPAACRRAFKLKMRGWQCETEILDAAQLQSVINRQLNPFTASAPGRPIAVMTSEAGSRQPAQLIAWPADGNDGRKPQIETLVGVTDPGDELFILDESALASMPLSDILMSI